MISISASHQPTRQALEEFLTQRGISSSTSTTKNPLGQSSRIVIENWDGARKFCHAILPYVIEKKRHIAIVFKIFQLRTKVALNDEMFISHTAEFDALRQELHALANKGPSLKREWENTFK